jgi:hypothetical protein
MKAYSKAKPHNLLVTQKYGIIQYFIPAILNWGSDRDCGRGIYIYILVYIVLSLSRLRVFILTIITKAIRFPYFEFTTYIVIILVYCLISLQFCMVIQYLNELFKRLNNLNSINNN